MKNEEIYLSKFEIYMAQSIHGLFDYSNSNEKVEKN